ncbi:MAG: hypothetical protein ACI9GW_003408, partial [Halieaceae bacterium]
MHRAYPIFKFSEVFMPEYKAPIRDIQFVMNDLLDCGGLYQSLP